MVSVPGQPVTLRDLYCADCHILRKNFETALFFACAPLHALALILLCDRKDLAIFAPDRELLARVAEAVALEDVCRAIDDHRSHPMNRTWPRRTARFRLSERRLSRIARTYLPQMRDVHGT